MRLIDWLDRLLDQQADARLLAIVRIVVGLAALGFAVDTWIKLGRLLDPQIVKMPYFAWLPRLSLSALPLFIGVWMLLALAFAVGLRTRLVGALLTAMLAYSLFYDQQLYSNHLYLMLLVTLLLTIADSGARYSIDARGAGARTQVPAWPILLLKLQVSIVYFYAALLKINPEYLSGAMMASFWPFNELAAQPGLWYSATLMQAFALLSVGTELFLSVALWLPRLRWLALLVGVGFHLMIVFSGGDAPGVPDLAFGIFAIVTIAPYALFFELPPARTAAAAKSG